MTDERPRFDFAKRFGRRPSPPAERVSGDGHLLKPGEKMIPVVLYCPFRCPFCGARYPKKGGRGRGRLPLHYLTCQECHRDYQAQEVDHAGLLRIVREGPDE